MTLNESKWKRWLFYAPLLIVPAGITLGADINPETIKATYILQMQKFVTFGESRRIMQRICYYERHGVPLDESVGQQIEKYVNAHPGDHLPAVRKLEAIRDMSGCDVFYIPAEEESDIDNILNALGSTETLTISGAKHFTIRGGMIGFVMDDESRVKMEANQTNAKARNVHIDVQLLEIMLHVINQ